MVVFTSLCVCVCVVCGVCVCVYVCMYVYPEFNVIYCMYYTIKDLKLTFYVAYLIARKNHFYVL